jgi:hypothetical protein
MVISCPAPPRSPPQSSTSCSPATMVSSLQALATQVNLQSLRGTCVVPGSVFAQDSLFQPNVWLVGPNSQVDNNDTMLTAACGGGWTKRWDSGNDGREVPAAVLQRPSLTRFCPSHPRLRPAAKQGATLVDQGQQQRRHQRTSEVPSVVSFGGPSISSTGAGVNCTQKMPLNASQLEIHIWSCTSFALAQL